jgi:hypothetical protein
MQAKVNALHSVSDEANMKINVKDTEQTMNVLFLVLAVTIGTCDGEGGL